MKRVSIIGVGPGNPDLLTIRARNLIESADILIGEERVLAPYCKEKNTYVSHDYKKISEYIKENEDKRIAALFSGDIEYFSGAQHLCPLLDSHIYQKIGGISSLQYFCDKENIPVDTVYSVSCHGKNGQLADAVRKHKNVFVLTGDNILDICAELTDMGYGNLDVTVGENMSYESEHFYHGTLSEACGSTFSKLNVLMIRNPEAVRKLQTGLRDDLFIRGQTPMTKSEIRSIVMSKLKLSEKNVCWDIGAGTGSVSIEMSLFADKIFAVEKHPAAVSLLLKNKNKFGIQNMEVIPGTAPKAVMNLPAPDAVFVGGSGGNLADILSIVFWKNPEARIVITAISLETLSQTIEYTGKNKVSNLEIIQANISKADEAGGYHLMKAQNPIYIISFQGVQNG